MLSQTTASALKDLIKYCKTAHCVPLNQTIIWAKADETLDHALSNMASHKVHSLPVSKQLSPDVAIGFVDIMDVLYWVLNCATLKENTLPICEHVINLSKTNPFLDSNGNAYKVTGETLLPTVLSLFVERNVHRLAVVRPDDTLISILSQIDVVLWLHNTIIENENPLQEFANQSVEQLKLGTQPVITIPTTSSVANAFSAILENKVRGVGIGDGKIIGHVNASDITEIGLHNFKQASSEPLSQFLGRKGTKFNPDVHVKSHQTLKDVLNIFKSKQVHRVFVFDSKEELCGIISAFDIIKLLHSLYFL